MSYILLSVPKVGVSPDSLDRHLTFTSYSQSNKSRVEAHSERSHLASIILVISLVLVITYSVYICAYTVLWCVIIWSLLPNSVVIDNTSLVCTDSTHNKCVLCRSTFLSYSPLS